MATLAVPTVLKIVKDNSGFKVEFVSNPGKYREPSFTMAENTFYLYFEGEIITGALAQANVFDSLVLSPQLEYQDNGIALRFVNPNNVAVLINCTMELYIKKDEDPLLNRPPSLGSVLKVRPNASNPQKQ